MKSIDFSTQSHKTIDDSFLEYLSSRQLFTKLYENCVSLGSNELLQHNTHNSFHFLKMSIPGYDIVITYLNRNISKKVKYSTDLTTIELRSRRGKRKVFSAIRKCENSSLFHVETSAGTMKILNYPIQLRVKTEYNRIYDKESNSPDRYTNLLGNHSDTTDFYIIGIIL